MEAHTVRTGDGSSKVYVGLKSQAGAKEKVPIRKKERCFLFGYWQMEFREFYPGNLYAPLAWHETIRTFLAKVAVKYLYLEGAEISNE